MKLASLSVALALATATPVMAAGIPVAVAADPVRSADFAKQYLRMKEQLDVALRQVAEVQRLHAAITGYRGFGALLRDYTIRQKLPEDMRAIYDDLGGAEAILRNESVLGTIDEIERQIRRRERQTVAAHKNAGLNAYDGTRQRLARIDAMSEKIKHTTDTKAAAELQALISAEQAELQNEANKLKLLAYLKESEMQLIEQQRKELSRRILSSSNTGMPTIR